MSEEGGRSGGLLKPSLSPETAIAPLYSAGTGYVLGVFGGPIAAGIVMAVNARRLGRLAQDAWIFVAVFVLSGVLLFAAFKAPELFTIELRNGEPRNVARLVMAGTGILTTGLLYLKYQTYYRAMALSGVESPSPWKMGIAVLAIAIAGQFALVFVLEYAYLAWTSRSVGGM